MFSGFSEHGVVGRSIKNNTVGLDLINPRDFSELASKAVDDRPFGGGPGMVMQAEPLISAVNEAKVKFNSQNRKVIYVSPSGKKFDQKAALELSKVEHLVFIAGRYEGIDERVIESCVDEQWSLGDYVISGGELAVMVMIDAIARLLPNTLGHVASATQDSFMNGLLDYPQYTRPRKLSDSGLEVPQCLISGDAARIAKWRHKQSLGRTWQRRKDLFENYELSEHELKLLNEFKQETSL